MKERNKQKGFAPILILVGAFLLVSTIVTITVVAVKYKDEIKSVAANISTAVFKSQDIKEQKTEEEATTETTSTPEIIEELKKEIEELKEQPQVIYRETIKEVPIVISDPTPTPQPAPQPASAPAQQVDCTYTCGGTCYPKTTCSTGHTFYCKTDGNGICCANDNNFCNNNCWSPCSSGQSFECRTDGGHCVSNNPLPDSQLDPTPTPIPTEKNYYTEAKQRLKMLVDVEESCVAWLQDTSDQFRSASLTLAGYNVGGLYGEARDAAIDLANAEIAAISSLIVNEEKRISSLESVLEILNSDPTGFIDKSTFDKIENPDSVQAEVEGVKASINETLNSVLNSLKYH